MATDMYVDLSDAAIGIMSQRLVHVVDAAAEIVRTSIVDQMSPGPTRTGREYYVPGTKTTYTASAPGQAPAERESIYVTAWKNTPAVQEYRRITAFVYNDVKVGSAGEYILADLLEHGTNDLVNYRVRMEPRPHIGPGIEAAIPKINAMIAQVRAA